MVVKYKVRVKGETDTFNTHAEAREYAIKLLQAGVTLIDLIEVKEDC